MRLLAISLVALASLLAPAGQTAWASEPVRVLWLLRSSAGAEETAIALQNEAGVPVDISFADVRAGSPEDIIIAAKRAIAFDEADLIFGLSLFDIEVLGGNQMLRQIPLKSLGTERSRSLFVTESLRGVARGSERDAESALALPLSLSAPMLCFDRDRTGFLGDFRPGIVELAYGKISQRLAFPDPRYDSAGRSALVSIFSASGGVNEGWYLFEELDRSIKQYSPNAYRACLDVVDGQAEVGFSSLVVADLLEGKAPRLGFQILDQAALVPVSFAAALDNGRPELSDTATEVLRWLLGVGLDRQLDALQRQLESRGMRYDVWQMAKPQGAMEYLPGEQLVNEWSARYDYKSGRSLR
ncbi:MAG TPA: hypothetical protein VLA52_16410 [Thermohalobaculum sp.]|nr:hypothetical protein [Thermohalobaculum sp.]